MSRFPLRPLRTRKPSFLPHLECLEDRSLPSCTASLGTDGVLTVLGDEARNVIAIRTDATDPTRLTVVCDGVTTGPAGPVFGLVVRGLGGNDSVTLSLGRPRMRIDVDLGDGDDTFDATVGGTSVSFDSLHLAVNGGLGNDLLSTNLTGATIDSLGGIDVTLSGGQGNDTLRSRSADLSARGFAPYVQVKLLGGVGTDQLSATYQGRLDGAFATFANGGPGADCVDLDVRLDTRPSGPLFGAALRLRARGSGGDDRLALAYHAPSAAPEDLDGLVDGGPGTDHCRVTRGVRRRGCE
jgi:hypothetical protein